MSRLARITYLLFAVYILVACADEMPTPENPVRSDSIPVATTNNTTQNGAYHIESVPIPSTLDFAGEEVPLRDADVRERLDRELLVNSYWQSQTILFHKRAARWFPLIEKILDEEGIPEDFKYLSLIESGFMNVVSPSGATGFWQFMPATARNHNLIVNDEVDERYHVEKSTFAACDYLKKAYDKFGNWTSAAASYNMGKTGLSNQMERQLEKNYYDLLLNNETSRYIFRILAVKVILSNSEQYGFYIPEEDLYKPHQTNPVQVDSTIEDIAVWAQANGTNYKWVKILNPWLRQKTLTVSRGESYEILLPKN